jgi:hypothetical protein
MRGLDAAFLLRGHVDALQGPLCLVSFSGKGLPVSTSRVMLPAYPLARTGRSLRARESSNRPTAVLGNGRPNVCSMVYIERDSCAIKEILHLSAYTACVSCVHGPLP